MPQFRQGSVGHVAQGAANKYVPPVAGARAGTTNPAGGLVTDIDARGYKNGTLYLLTGVLGTSVDAKVQSAAAAGGSYADITGAAAPTGVANTITAVDFEIDPGEPFLQIVHVQVGATAVGASFIQLHGPTRS